MVQWGSEACVRGDADLVIAVCDDDVRALKRMAGVLEEYAAACRLPLRYQLFENAEDMLRSARTERFTHYFLDVMMPRMDGITAAQEIRDFDPDAKLVFLTSFSEYAYQSYRVRAYDYLLKPVEPQTLTELLDRLQAEEEAAEECIDVQNGRSAFRIPLVRLAYLEVNQKKLFFYLTDGQIRQTPGTITRIEADLRIRPDFVKIHRSYIVNLNQISELSPEGCILFSGKNLPVSRLLYPQVRKAYMAHLFGDKGV